MGNGESHHHYYTTTYVYETPPAVKAELDECKASLAKLEAEAGEQGDPHLYAENSQKLLDNLVEKLPTLQLHLKEAISKKTGEEHVGILGPISAGKTTLLNTLFNLRLPVALGHMTKNCEAVHQVDHRVFWDVPGSNDDFRFYKAENLAFVNSLDQCVILFDTDIAAIANIIKVAYKLNPTKIVLGKKTPPPIAVSFPCA